MSSGGLQDSWGNLISPHFLASPVWPPGSPATTGPIAFPAPTTLSGSPRAAMSRPTEPFSLPPTPLSASWPGLLWVGSSRLLPPLHSPFSMAHLELFRAGLLRLPPPLLCSWWLAWSCFGRLTEASFLRWLPTATIARLQLTPNIHHGQALELYCSCHRAQLPQ